jgi:hypothetical protein
MYVKDFSSEFTWSQSKMVWTVVFNFHRNCSLQRNVVTNTISMACLTYSKKFLSLHMYIWIQQWPFYKGFFLIDIHLKRSELYLVFGFELKRFKFCFCSSWRCTSSTASRTASSSARSSTRRRGSTLRASPGGHFVKHNFGHFFRTHFFIFKHIFVIYETLTFFW